MPQFSEVYRELLDRCPPYRLPEPWHHLKTDGIAVLLPLNLQDVVNELVTMFGPDAVLKSGIASQTDAGLVAAEILISSDGVLVPVYDPTGTKIEDVITSVGCLSGKPVSVIPACDDEEVLNDLGCLTSEVYVVSSIPQLVIFLTLGLPATFYCGPTNNPQGYDLLTKWSDSEYAPRRRLGTSDQPPQHKPQTNSKSNDSISGLSSSGCELIFVAIDLINLTSSRPAQAEILEALFNSHPNQSDIEAFRWSPSNEVLEQLKNMLAAVASPGDLRNWIIESRDSWQKNLKPQVNLFPQSPKKKLPDNLVDMLGLIYGDSSDNPDPPEVDSVNEIYRHVNHLIFQELIRPVFTSVANEPEPALANIQAQFAMLLQLCHQQSVSLLARSHRGRREAIQAFEKTTEDLLPVMKLCLMQYQTIRSAKSSRIQSFTNPRRLSD